MLFTDSDLSAPIEELDALLEAAADGADVVIGSRAVDRRKIVVHQPWPREFGGIFYNWLLQLVLALPIKDTQCGVKLFTHDAAKYLVTKAEMDGFVFDDEVLYLAKNKFRVV